MCPNCENDGHRGFLFSYLSSSSIHGMKYISKKDPILSRLIWFALVTFCLVSAILIICGAFSSWKSYPIVTLVEYEDTLHRNGLFPDVTVYPRTYNKWRFIFDYISRKDVEDEIFNLFNNSVALTEILKRGIESVAEFQIYSGFGSQLDAEHTGYISTPELKSKIVSNICERAKDYSGANEMKHAINYLLSMYPIGSQLINFALSLHQKSLNKEIIVTKSNNSIDLICGSKDIDPNVFHWLGHGLIYSKMLLLYSKLTRNEMLVILMRIFELNPKTLPIEFQELRRSDLANVFNYISKMTSYNELFPQLPFPLPISIEVMFAQVTPSSMKKKLFGKDTESVFNFHHASNYDYGIWSETYRTIETCLGFKNSQLETCKQFDEKLKQTVAEKRDILLNMYPTSSFERSKFALASPPSIPICDWKLNLNQNKPHWNDAGFFECHNAFFHDRIITGSVTFRNVLNSNNNIRRLGDDDALVLVFDRGVGMSSTTESTAELDSAGVVFLHPQGSLPDVLSLDSQESIVQPGMKMVLRFDPTIYEVTDDFEENLSLKDRKCLLSSEIPNNLDLFKKYSQVSCMTDKGMIKMHRHCKCMPIFLADKNESVSLGLPLCGLANGNCWRYRIFEDVFNPVESGELDNQCLETCENIQYSVVSRQEKPLEYSIKPNDFIFNYLFKWDRQNIMSYAQLSGSPKQKSMVKERLSRLSVISINFQKRKFQKLVKDARANFSEQLSTIGGTLGFFSGFSLISLAELGYWAVFSVLRRYQQRVDSQLT